MEKAPTYLIATDLSDAAARATDCATMVAKKFNAELIFLHIFEVPDVDAYSNKLIATNFLNREIKKQLLDVVHNAEKQHGIKSTYLAKEGELFQLIAEGAAETNPDLFFVGTHGIRGVQHIIGSFIAKIINGSNVPVCVVQKESKVVPFENIIVYIDSMNRKPLHHLTLMLAKAFNSKLHFVFSEAPDVFAVSKMISEIKERLETEKISFDMYHLPDEHEHQKSFLAVADKHVAPLVIINRCGKVVDKAYEEIITNHQHLPVLCINND